jgi:hypothetical protein
MARKPLSVQVIEEGGRRFVETVFNDGEVLRTLVDPDRKPARRPRKPFARAVDYSKDKELKACTEAGTDPAKQCPDR